MPSKDTPGLYDPYGVPLQPNTSTTLGFTAEQTDPNDLLYLRARYYHPRLGAFTSVDPVLGVGGSTGWNGYLYANANPGTGYNRIVGWRSFEGWQIYRP